MNSKRFRLYTGAVHEPVDVIAGFVPAREIQRPPIASKFAGTPLANAAVVWRLIPVIMPGGAG